MKLKYLLLTLLFSCALQSAQYTISFGQRDYFDTSDGDEATTVSNGFQQIIDARPADASSRMLLDTSENGVGIVASFDFQNIQGTITEANLKIFAKPNDDGGGESNDVLGFGYNDTTLGTVYSYEVGIGSYWGNTSYFDFDWSAVNITNALNEGYEINIDLADFNSIGPYTGEASTLDLFNVNILNELNQYKVLDFAAGDDSTIDYIELTITTDSDPLITNFSVTALAGENGSVEPSSPVVYYSPTEVTLTATPEDGYVFSNWSGDITDLLSTNNPVILSVSSNTTITANFVASGSVDTGSDRIPQSLVNMIEIYGSNDSGGVVTGSFAALYNSDGTYTGIDIRNDEDPEYINSPYSWDPVAARATFPDPDGTDSNYYWDYQFQDFENSYIYPYTAVENISVSDPSLEPVNYVGIFYDGKADIDNNGKMDLFQIRDGDPFPDESFDLNNITDLTSSLWTNLTVGKVIEYKSYKSNNLDDWELFDTKLVPLDTDQDQVFIKSEVNILE